MEPDSPPRWKDRCRRVVKAVVLAAYVYVWAPLRNLWRRLRGRAHATVLTYHRVSDAYRDAVTVGVEQFRRHLAILKRHYDVQDMPAFLAGRGAPRRRPCVVITFDDGYEDNYHAAGMLREAGLQATFFLSTRIVGTDEAFAHDLKRLGRRVPTLSWEQVREMAGWGFHFGTHTARHANVAAMPLRDAVGEITTARDDLLRRLGATGAETWFAYPHGRRKDISPEVRSALAECGVEYCFSAYGGVNGPDFDPLDIRRQAVDHKFSDLAFRAAVEGWQLR